MKMQHTPYHWLMVALVLVALMLALSEAHGQSGAATQFEGRPAMSGAQGGQGAQAGPAQGGIGMQGSDLSERSLKPSRTPTTLDEMRQVHRQGGDMMGAGDQDASLRKDTLPPKDQGIAKAQSSASKKAAKGAKNTRQLARHGTPTIDSTTQVETTPPAH